MTHYDTYYVPADGSNHPAEEVVAKRMAKGEHVHTWAVETGILCLAAENQCVVKDGKLA